MPRWVALLRGVNVGGHGRLPMAEFRHVLELVGAADITTYLQSGNGVFSAEGTHGSLVTAIAGAIASELGMDTKVLVRSARQMATVLAANPFPGAAAAPKTLHVAFLSAAPTKVALNAIDRPRYTPDEFKAEGTEIYVHVPNGFADTKLTNTLWERSLGVTSTTRNWNTVTKLAELAAGCDE